MNSRFSGGQFELPYYLEKDTISSDCRGIILLRMFTLLDYTINPMSFGTVENFLKLYPKNFSNCYYKAITIMKVMVVILLS